MNLTYAVLSFPLFLALAAALAYKYRTTREPGFLFLAVPLVLFPVLNLPLSYAINLILNRLNSGGQIGLYPFTLVETGRMTMGDLVVLIATVKHVLRTAFLVLAILMFARSPRPTPSA